LTCLINVEQSALQIVRNVGVVELIDYCSLLIRIVPNSFSLSPVLIALDNRAKTKKKINYKLKKETKALINGKAKDITSNNFIEIMFYGTKKNKETNLFAKILLNFFIMLNFVLFHFLLHEKPLCAIHEN
jgi:hypothetical protein